MLATLTTKPRPAASMSATTSCMSRSGDTRSTARSASARAQSIRSNLRAASRVVNPAGRARGAPHAQSGNPQPPLAPNSALLASLSGSNTALDVVNVVVVTPSSAQVQSASPPAAAAQLIV